MGGAEEAEGGGRRGRLLQAVLGQASGVQGAIAGAPKFAKLEASPTGRDLADGAEPSPGEISAAVMYLEDLQRTSNVFRFCSNFINWNYVPECHGTCREEEGFNPGARCKPRDASLSVDFCSLHCAGGGIHGKPQQGLFFLQWFNLQQHVAGPTNASSPSSRTRRSADAAGDIVDACVLASCHDCQRVQAMCSHRHTCYGCQELILFSERRGPRRMPDRKSVSKECTLTKDYHEGGAKGPKKPNSGRRARGRTNEAGC